MTPVTWPAHEVRRCGRQAYALPVLASLLACAATAADPDGGMFLGRSLLTSALPVATALACAAILTREPMLELHLSLPTSYARTVLRRLAWPGTVTVLTAPALVALAAASGSSPDPMATLAELAGLTVLLSGAAVWATVRSGSAAPATGLVVAVVLAKLLVVDRVVPEGAGQALPALLVGVWLTTLALRSLGFGGRSGARLGPGSDPRLDPGEA